MRSITGTHVLVVAAVLSAGCFSYKPLAEPRPGMDVRAQLTNDAAVRHSKGLAEPILHYDGVVVETDQDSLALSVLIARSSSAFQDIEIRDTVLLGNAEIESILGRKLSPTKSILSAVVAGAAAFAIVKGFDQIVGGTGEDTGNPPPPAARVPVARWLGVLLRPVFGHAR